MCTQPDTAGHLLNIYIEPSVPANVSSQGGYASEPTAAKVDVLRLCARAPTIRGCYVGWVIVGTGVNDLYNHVGSRAAVRIMRATTAGVRSGGIAFNGNANATVPVRLGFTGTGWGLGAIPSSTAWALTHGNIPINRPETAQIARGTVVARIVGNTR